MSYTTVEVVLEAGRVQTRGGEILPPKTRALLTLLDPAEASPTRTAPATGAGLRRFLSAPDFPLTPAQFRASMEADFFDQ